jgi:peptidoglycan hydrolase-like protein with peptidoglycan-binding domain
MDRWKRFVALSAALLLVAAPVWAQSSTSSPADKNTGGASGKMGSGTTGSTGTMDKSTDTTAAGSADKMDKGDKAQRARGGKGDRMAGGGQNKEQVKAVQQALKDKGHDPGDVDGVMGQKTKSALRDFQKKEGLKGSGQLDTETMSKLGVEMKTGSAGASSPSASPATGDKASGGSASSSTGGAGSSSAPGASSTSSGGSSPSAGGGATTGGAQKK